MAKGFTGGCLCGAVRYQSLVDPQFVAHCYCSDCRKLSGTGHSTHLVSSEQGFDVVGELRFYEHTVDSGNVRSIGFCPNCGSHVYSTNSGKPGIVFPRASSLDDPEIAKPMMTVYASRAASWDRIDPSIPSFSEMPEGGLDKIMADKA